MIQHAVFAVLGLSLQLQVATIPPDRCIYGSVTSTSTLANGAPIASAAIEITGGGSAARRFLSEASGAYSLPPLDAGMYTLRFEREGFIPLSLEVRVPAQGAVHLDVTLDPIPPSMQTVKIVAREYRQRVESRDDDMLFSANHPWQVTGDELATMPALDFPDVARAIATSPFAQISPESSGGLHLQGGTADHTQLLLDGIPLYNAVHSGDRPGAIDPDAVARISVYGEPSARDGGRLTGVVDVRTRATLPDSESVRGTIWPTGVRALTIVPFGKTGSATIAARRNYLPNGLGNGNGERPLTFGWSDLFATASLPLYRGTLTAMAFSASDAVGFDAMSEGTAPNLLANGNRLSWTSDARALTYHQASRRRTIEAKVWQSGSRVGADWLAKPDQSLSLANNFTQTAATASVSWIGTKGETTVGATLEQLSARYATLNSIASAGSIDNSPGLTLGERSRVGSAFFEQSLAPGDRFRLTFGGRAVSVNGSRILLEPRASARFVARSGAALSLAFAHTHQYAQSLYNEESLVDAVASLELPVLSGTGGVPVASSSSISGQLALPIGLAGRLTVGGYARTFKDLVLPGPSTVAPFPTQSFMTGNGSAFGGGINFREQLGRLQLDGAYSLSAVLRESFSEKSYRPAFAPIHSVRLAAGYQLSPGTLLRSSASMSAGRITSPVTGPVALEWQDALTAQREIAGSPQYSNETFATGRLPSYLRIDLGVRHDLRWGGRLPGATTLFANVDNLFGRRNAIGLTQSAGALSRSSLLMLPRSLSLGIAWRF
jgi:hypothetical protein